MLLLQNPGQGKTFFLSTTQYKLIKCGSSTHIIQSRTKLNTSDVPHCQNMQKKKVEDELQKAPHS